MAFCVLAISALSFAQSAFQCESVFHASTHNRSLFWAMTASAVILAAIVFLPPPAAFFKLTTLPGAVGRYAAVLSSPSAVGRAKQGIVRLKRHAK